MQSAIRNPQSAISWQLLRSCAASQTGNRRHVGHETQNHRDGEIKSTVEKRAARVEVERSKCGQRSGGEDRHKEHDHLPNFETVFQEGRTQTEEAITKKPVRTPQRCVN